MKRFSSVGHSVPRKEGLSKVTGTAKYVDDLHFEGMIFGATIRSKNPRGKIKNVRFDPKINWNEFTLVSASDIPGKNYVTLITNDQPYLADREFNHAEEPVCLLAHRDRFFLEKARRHVFIEEEPLPPVLSLGDSAMAKTVIWGKDNIFKSYLVDKGNVDSVWEDAAFIVEREYFTGAQEQLYIEPNGMVAIASPKEGVTVWGSMQCPYYVHKALVPLFGLPEDRVRVIQTETGGGFGGKEEYPSLIAGHAALLAWKSGRPVKIIYDRAEDMVATTKRHPSRTRHKTAVSREGKLLAMEISFDIDGGAYNTLSPVVLSRGTLHAAGVYSCPHVRIRSRALATNSPPHGAFRGFGAPQSIFALERQLDIIAKIVGLSPDEVRRKNFLKTGDTTATGQVIREKIDLSGLLDSAIKKSGYRKKQKMFLKENENNLYLKRGVGLATFMHGAGFTGSGEKFLASVVSVEATSEGRVRVLTASTEIGQGTNTVFSQIAAETLNIPYEWIDVATPDTSQVPNSGPTVASRTCMVVGKLVETAATGLKQTLVTTGYLKRQDYSQGDWRKACQAYLKKFGSLKSSSQYVEPPHIQWDDVRYQGDAYGTYAFAAYVTEVAVDINTYETTVKDFVAVQEVGRVIHPVMAAGQIEGGVAQGIGYTLYEKVIWRNGKMINNQMTNYIMPTALDVPPIRVFFEENPYSFGAFGSKGIGELPMDGPAPAILNALQFATGKECCAVPLLPEDLMKVLHG